MKANIAKVYLDMAGHVCFQIGSFHIEYIALHGLTDINSVKEYDDTGYVVLNTNYGEEFYDIGSDIDELGLGSVYDIKQIMDSIKQWDTTGGHIKPQVDAVGSGADLIVDDVAFYKVQHTGRLSYRVVDLRDTKSIGTLVLNPEGNKFILVNSTFPDDKRKYQMLYYQERNREILLDAAEHYKAEHTGKK